MAKVTLAYSDTLAQSQWCHYRSEHLYSLLAYSGICIVLVLLPESYGVLEGEEDDDECVDGVEGDGDEGRPVGLAALRLHRLQGGNSMDILRVA